MNRRIPLFATPLEGTDDRSLRERVRAFSVACGEQARRSNEAPDEQRFQRTLAAYLRTWALCRRLAPPALDAATREAASAAYRIAALGARRRARSSRAA
jgi:hypothetical protein